MMVAPRKTSSFVLIRFGAEGLFLLEKMKWQAKKDEKAADSCQNRKQFIDE